MQAEKLSDIKKELNNLSTSELISICLRLAKYKKENKELLSYLLYDAEDPVLYSQKIKTSLQNEFIDLKKHYYYSAKSLRKILRTINRHAKYTSSKQAEIELLIWFSDNFLIYADIKSSHKPLIALFTRQLEKIKAIIPKLHEDLQFDYKEEFYTLLDKATAIKGFNKRDYEL